MIKDNCKHIPLHLLNAMIENNGQTSSGEYDMTALLDRRNELEERNADSLFNAHMAGLFEQAASMVASSKAVIAKAMETIKANKSRFQAFFVKTYYYKIELFDGHPSDRKTIHSMNCKNIDELLNAIEDEWMCEIQKEFKNPDGSSCYRVYDCFHNTSTDCSLIVSTNKKHLIF